MVVEALPLSLSRAIYIVSISLPNKRVRIDGLGTYNVRMQHWLRVGNLIGRWLTGWLAHSPRLVERESVLRGGVALLSTARLTGNGRPTV